MDTIDDLLPKPDDDSISPSQLVADIDSAQEVERAALEQKLVAAGFNEVSVAAQGFGALKFDLVFRGSQPDGSKAFGLLEAALEEFGLIMDEKTYEMEIMRNWARTKFLCFRDNELVPV